MDAQTIADWRGFFGMAAGTAAGLAGLVFVALSLHLKGIRAHPPYRYPHWASCGDEDPGHNRAAGLRQFNGGACDGWLSESPDTYPISFHTADQLGFWGTAAPAWTVC